jgi:hypothetical protein
MATNEWKDRAADAARQAAERRETGGGSGAAGGAKGPGDTRVPGLPEQSPEQAQDRVAGAPGDRMPRDGPEPEEVPELLGERSDYPVPRGEGEE